MPSWTQDAFFWWLSLFPLFTQHNTAVLILPFNYNTEQSRAEQCTFPQIDAQTRHFDAFLRCHDFSFRLTLATLSCWCDHDVHVSPFLMTDDVQVPTPALLSLYDDLTLMTTAFDAMLTTTVPKIDDPDDNNYEHLWSSGTTYPCHGWDPGSIPGKCTFWLIPAHWLPIFLSFLLWYRP